MTRLPFLIATVLTIASTAADADPSASDILDRAAAALEADPSWSFHIERRSSGPGAAVAIDLDADAVIVRTPEDPHLGAHLDIRGTYTLATSPAPDPMLLRYDGERALSVRERGGVVIAGDPANMGLALIGIGYDSPLFDAIIDPAMLRSAAGGATLLPPRIVGGELCDGIYLGATEDAPGVTWYFDADDHLPRRVDVIDGHGPDAVSTTTLITGHRRGVPFPSLDHAGSFTVKSFDPARLPAVGGQAPDLTITTPDGREVSLADHRGKVVVVKFWATWCGACVAGLPALGDLRHDFADDERVAFMGVNCWDKGDIGSALAKAGCDVSSGVADDDQIAAFGVTALPIVLVIDPEGRIAHAQLGYRPDAESTLRAAIDALLAAE